MDANFVCTQFLNIDKFFNKNNIVDKKIFDSRNNPYKQYCLNRNCDSNRRRIAALSRHLSIVLKIKNKDEYDIFFLMWLSDKLFKIHNKGKGKDNNITLISAYDKYFKNNIENVNFWNLLHNIMLFNHTCKTVANYNTKGAGDKALLQHSGLGVQGSGFRV
ncbi:hypothetical protein YYE_00004 [Plasmodium vinckei vinckei]|nr:hypothetical protein YYE_00004 [Plasmodium vinckei vinckei]